jgi:hypothetical protein
LTPPIRASLQNQQGLREAILSILIASYVKFTSQSEQQYVLRKVCSTLAAFFLHPNSFWDLPVRDIVTSLCHGQRAQEGSIHDFSQTWARIEHISSLNLRSALWLCSSLVEETTKTDLKGPERYV